MNQHPMSTPLPPSSGFVELTKVCCDCDQPFTLTAAEQEWFDSVSLWNRVLCASHSERLRDAAPV
jgi:hypothetical protein